MTLNEIKSEMSRVGAADAEVTLDADFAPEAGELVKVELAGAYWHLGPEQLLSLLKVLSDGAGSEAVQETIERNATPLWHGPAPEGSRDAPP